jgi:hypothetical protein
LLGLSEFILRYVIAIGSRDVSVVTHEAVTLRVAEFGLVLGPFQDEAAIPIFGPFAAAGLPVWPFLGTNVAVALIKHA